MTFKVSFLITADGSIAKSEIRALADEERKAALATQDLGRQGKSASGDVRKLGKSAESASDDMAKLAAKKRRAARDAAGLNDANKLAAGKELIDRYDGPGTLFYLDPPYWGCEDDYGKAMFERADFERLAEQLACIKGRFLMSINDVPEVREVFVGFEIERVETTYTIAKTTAQRSRVGELLIAGK